MSDTYTPPKVWTWDSSNGGQFASINRPIAGNTHFSFIRWQPQTV
jgi:GST-like protein